MSFPARLRPVLIVPLILVVLVSLLWGIFALLGSLFGAAESSSEHLPEPHTPPLSREGFDPGLIISDKVFFRPRALSQEQVSEFISKVNRGCRPGPDGTPCLGEYTEDSPSFKADEFCKKAFVGQSGDTAAQIVFKASQACGLNPAVLLVTLQKEQGLLTASSDRLTPRRYQIAMGYACPDFVKCDPRFEGFSKQVYYAARQLARYGLEDGKYDFYAGERAKIQFNPDPKCGSAPVRIKNRATAALYNYTPYQPNKVTLQGGSDDCTAWGNINFYSYFKAWFGDPRS